MIAVAPVPFASAMASGMFVAGVIARIHDASPGFGPPCVDSTVRGSLKNSGPGHQARVIDVGRGDRARPCLALQEAEFARVARHVAHRGDAAIEIAALDRLGIGQVGPGREMDMGVDHARHRDRAMHVDNAFAGLHGGHDRNDALAAAR